MLKKYTKTIQFILTDQDAKSIKTCLGYCSHRIHKHNKKIGCRVEEVDRLVNEFNKPLFFNNCDSELSDEFNRLLDYNCPL